MKKINKIMSLASATMILGSVALADSTNLGLTLSYGNLDATGSHTTNSAGSGGGGAAVSESGNANFPFGSIFAEREFAGQIMNVSLGLDYIPLKAEVENMSGGTGTDVKVNVKNIYTLYLQPSKKLDNGLSIFARVGYTQGDLNITDVRRQTTTAGTAGTDTGATRDLKGAVFGVGVEKNFDNGAAVRLGITRTEYDEISYTTSNSKVIKADPSLTAVHLSFVKKF